MTESLLQKEKIGSVTVYELSAADILRWGQRRSAMIDKPDDDPDNRSEGLFEAMYGMSPMELKMCCHLDDDDGSLEQLTSKQLAKVIEAALRLSKDFFDRKANLLRTTDSPQESSSNPLQLASSA